MLLFILSCLESARAAFFLFSLLVHVGEEGAGEGLVLFPLVHNGEVKKTRKRFM